jgi:hypothetical protein
VGSAFSDFELTLRQAEILIEREHRYLDPPRPRSANAVLGLRGGATVLMVATFERFLQEMFAEHLEKLASDPPPVAFTDLPSKLQISSVFNSLDRAIRGPRFGEPTGKEARLADVQRAAELIVAGVIDPVSLSNTSSNPDATTVKRLFAEAGIPEIFNVVRPAFDALWPKTEASGFLRDKLDEIVNSRHRVAHRADALSISRVQLSEWPDFLKALARVLDAQLEQHVDALMAAASGRP